MPKRLALFASGTGSNVRNLYHRFRNSSIIEIALIVCNKPDAPVTDFAREQGIPLMLVDKASLNDPGLLTRHLLDLEVDLIVLAGFLWLIPEHLIESFPGRIVNLHPSLLPRHGGKGMYGQKVHEAVLACGEQESGITIHKVNGRYDDGDIIFQAKCSVMEGDTPETLAQKIHQLEYEHLPEQIEHIVSHLP